MRTPWIWIVVGLGCGGKDDPATDAPDGDADTDADADTDTDLFPDLDPDLPTATLVLIGFEAGRGGGTTSTSFDGPLGAVTAGMTPAAPFDLDTCVLQSAATDPTTPTTPPPGPDPLDPGEVTVTIGGDPVGRFGTFPEWTPGAPVSFAATGNEFPAFSVPALLTLPPFVSPASSVGGDGSVEVTWTPGDEGAFTGIVVNGVDDTLSCYVEDDGAFTIAASDVAAVGAVESTIVSRYSYSALQQPDCNVLGVATTAGSP